MRGRSVLKAMVPLAALMVLGASRPAGELECIKADRWIAQQQGALPSTFGELSRYSPVYQNRIFAALPLGDKQSLWRQHLELVLESGTLTGAQAMVVREWLGRLDEFFDPSLSDSERKARMDSTKSLIESRFTPKLARDVFYVRGVLARARTATTPASATDCNCATSSDCPGSSCYIGGCTSRNGCGIGGNEPCFGECVISSKAIAPKV